jgi:methylenetetrahydrofolate reductase (NADPH)
VQSGIEPIFQMTCRDRNRLALQGDLLGALSLGIRNVLVLGGDDPKAGDQPEAKPVYDLDSRGLLAMADGMRAQGKLPSGTKIDGQIRLVLGAADVPLDPPAGWQPNSLKLKIAAGADFVQTQFCMDMDVVRRYVARLEECGVKIPILIGVAPIPSARSARWMREKLFGTIIPDAHIDRLERARDAKAEGRKICIEVMRSLAEIPGVAGAHVMAPMNFAEIPAVIVESGVAGRKLAHAVH